ncbi:phage protein Gp36 family protein [Epilithonimonas mollis]|uniref:Mu-like prophage protein gp36 n=1 Tax=Epilithonimonas mollis TaxID=216903 RepID=A0A1M6UKB8_9FLAO|nr:phage protein Gp36 family protein [Epilithonimonas mollis]SHK69609.1 Mu-like prophage protein gp36 [Epilithonimonas mollis]
MAFLKDEDYSVLVRTEIKDILLENYSDTKLKSAEQMATSQVKNYLSGKYDVAAIFSAQDDERNSHIIMIVLDCALYHLYTSTVPKRMPDIRSQRYQDAIDWLKLVATGEATADLPIKTDGNGNKLQGIKISSKYPASNQRW